ncbi:MAG TPA: hydrogenase maturation protease [Gemmatimonadales bacterium]|nr:hydrogenase maturation protease [Gemmatimonadales bacterium]
MAADGTAERVVVVGLGNPLLTDDAVGVRAAEILAERLAATPVDVVQSAWGGMRFVDLLAGYDRAIIVDAIEWRRGPPGTIYRLTPDEAIPTLRAVSYHDVSLGTALALGRTLDIPLPTETVFFAVEAQETRMFGEQLTPAVRAALPELVRRVEAQLMQWKVLGVQTCTKQASPRT